MNEDTKFMGNIPLSAINYLNIVIARQSQPLHSSMGRSQSVF